MSAERIFASGLRKDFGPTHALQGIDLLVRAGEIYALVGPDGAGKTTTLRLLCGAIRPGAGKIRVAGFELPRQVEWARAATGYLSQRFSLYDDLTVSENLRFFGEVRGLAAKDWLDRSAELLALVGLAEFSGRRAGALSGGMRQKLALAVALVTRPAVLLLDEPTTGVDPGTRQDFWQLILRLAAAEGIAVLVCTPYMDEAARCTRVGFLRQGKLVVEGSPGEVSRRLAGRVWEVSGSPPEVLLRIAESDAGVEGVQRFGDRLHVRARTAEDGGLAARLAAAAAAAGGQVQQCELVQPGLEDVFIALAQEAQ